MSVNQIKKTKSIVRNRNVIERAKTALPYLLYDENAYTVIKDNQIYWVIVWAIEQGNRTD